MFEAVRRSSWRAIGEGLGIITCILTHRSAIGRYRICARGKSERPAARRWSWRDARNRWIPTRLGLCWLRSCSDHMLVAGRSTEGGRSRPPARFARVRPTDGPTRHKASSSNSANASRGGTIFGCGNQQLSPQVIQAGRDNIIVNATLDRLYALDWPRRVETGDRECDRFHGGYVRVITGERERAIWQVAA